MQEHRFNIFGLWISVCGEAGAWRAFYLGNEGKRRAADFIIPAGMGADELCEYLADLFHEHASPHNPHARRLDL